MKVWEIIDENGFSVVGIEQGEDFLIACGKDYDKATAYGDGARRLRKLADTMERRADKLERGINK